MQANRNRRGDGAPGMPGRRLSMVVADAASDAVSPKLSIENVEVPDRIGSRRAGHEVEGARPQVAAWTCSVRVLSCSARVWICSVRSVFRCSSSV